MALIHYQSMHREKTMGVLFDLVHKSTHSNLMNPRSAEAATLLSLAAKPTIALVETGSMKQN
jgi:hypothetical protein